MEFVLTLGQLQTLMSHLTEYRSLAEDLQGLWVTEFTLLFLAWHPEHVGIQAPPPLILENWVGSPELVLEHLELGSDGRYTLEVITAEDTVGQLESTFSQLAVGVVTLIALEEALSNVAEEAEQSVTVSTSDEGGLHRWSYNTWVLLLDSPTWGSVEDPWRVLPASLRAGSLGWVDIIDDKTNDVRWAHPALLIELPQLVHTGGIWLIKLQMIPITLTYSPTQHEHIHRNARDYIVALVYIAADFHVYQAQCKDLAQMLRWAFWSGPFVLLPPPPPSAPMPAISWQKLSQDLRRCLYLQEWDCYHHENPAYTQPGPQKKVIMVPSPAMLDFFERLCKILVLHPCSPLAGSSQYYGKALMSTMVGTVQGKRHRWVNEISRQCQYRYLLNAIELVDQNDDDWEDEPLPAMLDGPTSIDQQAKKLSAKHYANSICIDSHPGYHEEYLTQLLWGEVLDINRIHKVAIDYCACEERLPDHVQLLQFGWFPVTMRYPQTCMTFHLLEHFQTTLLASKISVYEYYQALLCLTDVTAVSLPKWCHLKLLERFGQEHTVDGVASIPEGALALCCPVCPQPDENMPEGWQDAAKEDQYLHQPIIAVDANFCLKNLHKSTQECDPKLHTGQAYFVEHEKCTLPVMSLFSSDGVADQ
ncbi:hypothetical protein ARMGADRAFT_1031872 [Armillaria gallica]|uniref:CxC2-like cysteine cluster KDZ transposase-associated domain-containing protein n=1 Tax=Armillaria gallica TaxID=47427 RepID=A0A2H3DAQ3_ARMGA|nr:hypothetical protein ARMGADRAFT_1031872 [Armillaria gallica]